MSISNWPHPQHWARDDRDLDPAAVLATLLDSVACGVLVFDARGELRLASGPVAGMLQIETERLSALADFEAVVAELAQRFTEPEVVAASWRAHFAAGEPSWDELELAAAPRKVLERFARPIADPSGRRVGWLEVYRDVTGRRLMESKIFHTERMVALGQLVSSVAHEINNPLTSIFGNAQLLLRRGNGLGPDREARMILQEAQRASRIAKNLLLFARGAKVEHTRADLNEIVRRTMSLRTDELRLSGIQVELDLDPGLPPVLADPAQLQQMLLNIVVNAEQAIQQRSGRGHIWLRTRRVSAERVALDVADDGPGIAPELLPRVFDPFFSTKPPGVGTGLGLSIAYGIAREHGGEVFVESHPGWGAAFTVELPPAGAANLAPARSPSRETPVLLPAHRPVQRASRQQRILVVEDEPTVARLIADVMAEDGHAVDTALDSREGLGLILRKDYDLVICDLRMPHLDGRTFYRELLRLNSPLAQRLVFVTGDALSPRTIDFLESSGVPYLAKPFLVEELREMVHRALTGARLPTSNWWNAAGLTPEGAKKQERDG
jgi:signal transduction histidine kinase/ActR/RegA family two-component response regulator